MPPTITENTKLPPGVLPQNLRYILLAAIAVLILVTSFFSGRSGRRATDAPTATAPVGATSKDVSAFTKILEQRREAEEARAQLEARLAEEKRQALVSHAAQPYYGVAEQQRAVSAPQVDPFEQKRREREELAPFASNIALTAPQTEDHSRIEPQGSTPKPSQALAEIPAQSPTRNLPETSNTGSGKYLPEKENGLFRIYEGTFVETTLANRLEGSFTGPVKCIVSKDLRAKTGEALLIPVGSQFFGEAKRVESAGQTRLAVTFKRLLLPNGYSVDLENAPGLNKEGDTGLKDQTNNHYLRTLGISGAVGLLGGFALYGGRAASGYEYATGVANTEGGAATTILSRSLNLLPTITIREGHTVNVYLSADLQMPAYRP